MFNIKEELKKLPKCPGVYIMKDNKGQIIYIGKAVNLKNRIRQYFQSLTGQSQKVVSMVEKIKEFEYIITDSELEALILECNLIKKHRPKYNILLKDDKNYPYIKVTINEDYPRIFIVRKIEKDGAKYFGPYSSSFYVNDILETIKRVFPVRTCKKVLPRDIGKTRPCLNFHINKCLAPCQGEISKEEYKNMINEICLFLGHRHDELIKKLENEMQKSSQNLNFERAAKLRDKINSIKHISQRQKVISTAMEDQDIIAFAVNNAAVVQVFFIRRGKLIGRENFMLDGAEETSKEEILGEFIKQFYSSVDYIPKEILLQEEIDEISIIENWLTSKKGSKVYIRVPRKGEKHDLVDMAYKNALFALESLEPQIRESHLKQEVLLQLQELLELNKLPKRIEAYDISNISGSLSVGSMVVFIDGKKEKSQYRRFKIKYVQGQNDYESIKEVLYRRYKKSEFAPLPDLICIDGGKGHVNSANQVLKEIELDIEVCGMVKDQRHKTKGLIYKQNEYLLSNNKNLFSFICEIQDEVHRFAIDYHKKLREKQIKDSILDEVSGIGEKRKLNLLKHFKNIDNIKKATVEDFKKVDGMNNFAAQSLYDFFNKD